MRLLQFGSFLLALSGIICYSSDEDVRMDVVAEDLSNQSSSQLNEHATESAVDVFTPLGPPNPPLPAAPLALYHAQPGEPEPPPGTLGRTYLRKSHAIPSDKHPRTAMLAVRNSIHAPLLSAQNMGGFKMKNGVWLFETSRPLDFGANHVIRVEARSTVEEVEPSAVRFVRLIPGRLVYLDF